MFVCVQSVPLNSIRFGVKRATLRSGQPVIYLPHRRKCHGARAQTDKTQHHDALSECLATRKLYKNTKRSNDDAEYRSDTCSHKTHRSCSGAARITQNAGCNSQAPGPEGINTQMGPTKAYKTHSLRNASTRRVLLVDVVGDVR